MKKYKSFEEFLQDQYEDELYKAVKGFVIENRSRIDFGYTTIEDISFVELDQISINNVSVRFGQNSKIVCNTAIEADVIIRGRGRRDYEEDEKGIWVSVEFDCTLKNGLHNFRILRTEEYSKYKFDKNETASKFLVPYVYAEDLEARADEFLKAYCWEVISEPYPLPIDLVLQRMNLSKKMAPLQDTIFGKTIFVESKHEVYDSQYKIIKETVLPGTILYNPDVFFMRNIGSVNNTIIHECVHWHLHSLFFELQKLLNGDLSAISCEVDEYRGEKSEGLEGALQWMEWQANAITPRILMPAKSTKRKLNEILRKLHSEFPEQTESMHMEMAIKELAEFFNVSKFAAKLRAIDLGYQQAAGVYNYVDGSYLPSFSFKESALKKDETYIIDCMNATFETYIDENLKDKIGTGEFIHVDYMICINDEKYVDTSIEGRPTLTEYAREHVDECCIKFKNSYKKSKTSNDGFYSRCCLCKDIDSKGYCEPSYIDDEDNQDVRERAREMKKLRDEGKKIMEIYNSLPMSFAGTLDAHMKRLHQEDGRKMTNLELSLRTGLSDTYIGMLRKDVSKKTTLETACAICIGLHLHPIFSHDLIRKSNNAFPTTEEGFFGRFLIDQHFMDSLELCNQKLRENGFKEWGKDI